MFDAYKYLQFSIQNCDAFWLVFELASRPQHKASMNKDTEYTNYNNEAFVLISMPTSVLLVADD